MKGGFTGGSKYDARPMRWWEPWVMATMLFSAVVVIGNLLYLFFQLVRVIAR